MDVAEWLRALGLERYEATFRDNEITAAVLPNLSAEDLKDLGITAVGHRRQLLDAISALRMTPQPDQEIGRFGAERRQVSVMFCDMANSTALSTRLDPEDLSAVIRSYQACVAATIARFSGFIAHYVGDGILIYFGWPEARETDAERAVRAALAVIAAISQAPIHGERLQVHIGIATGLVVIGETIGTGGAREQTAIGETPNLAARLQALAGAGGIAIDATTRRQLGGLFDYHDLGRLDLKGFSDPVSAWLVTGEQTVDSRFEALHAETLTPLIGRDVELALLESRWRQIQGGHCQAILLSGEAGIGKSRLIAELDQRLERDAPSRLRFFCSPDQTDTPLHPVIGALRRDAHFTRDDSDAESLRRLRSLLAPATLNSVEIALIADILSVAHSEMHAIRDMSPLARKERTLAALVAWAKSLGSARPLLITIEDTHWADPSSLEYFNALIPALSDMTALFIISSRTDETRVGIGAQQVHSLILPRLTRRHAATLAASITAGETLSPQMLDRIVEQTDGIPLFVVELTKTVLETSTDSDTDPTRLSVPVSLQASLMARLDRIPAAKEMAQIGAVLGREFQPALLAAVAGVPEPDLQRGLQQLVDAELVTCERTTSEISYVFKHALIRDTAYDMLLRSRRRELHANAARALEDLSPEGRDGQPELLAYHYTQAGMAERAIAHWAKAARRSVARSAMVEAAAQLRQALELVPQLPEGPTRLRQELELQGALGGVLFALHAWADGAAMRSYARAHQLAQQLGDSEEIVRFLASQVTYHIGQCQYARAHELAVELLQIADREKTPSALLIAHRCMGVCLHWTGEFAGALDHFDRVLCLYDPSRDRQLAALLGFDVSIQAGILSCWDLLILGLPEQALRRFVSAREQVHEVDNKLSKVFALGYGGIFSLIMQDQELAFRQLTEAAELATEQRFTAWEGTASAVLGAVFAMTGNPGHGLEMVRAGHAKYVGTVAQRPETGLTLNATYYLGLLAGACEAAGIPAEARVHLDSAINAAGRSGERWFEPELHRLKGEWLLHHAQGQDAEAEASFAHAIELAARQRALFWELRASMSLARLYVARGEVNRVRDALAPTYERFREGLNLPDLRQARSLLVSV
jgi:class 3 adenylate cyclase/predicted ATPase